MIIPGIHSPCTQTTSSVKPGPCNAYFSVLRIRMPASRNCSRDTGPGASVSMQLAVWVFGTR